MSILGLIGSLLGGFGGNKQSAKNRRESRSAQPTDRVSQSSGTDQVKAKAAGKLALIKSGSRAGVLGDTPIGRKKLLGN